MTLDTSVYVLDEVPVDDLFIFCQTLLGEYDDDRRGPERQRFRNKQDSTWRAGEAFTEPGNPWSMANEIGQGLPAILEISYRPDAPLRTAEDVAPHTFDGWCNHPENAERWYRSDEELCTKTEHATPCWLEISFDTSYGYRDERGWGCGDLHAMLVSRVGQWLDERGARWKWRNEYSGEIHEGYERLVDLVADGFAGTAWFLTTVLPAIDAGLLDGQDGAS